jgi:hypothetical protein
MANEQHTDPHGECAAEIARLTGSGIARSVAQRDERVGDCLNDAWGYAKQGAMHLEECGEDCYDKAAGRSCMHCPFLPSMKLRAASIRALKSSPSRPRGEDVMRRIHSLAMMAAIVLAGTEMVIPITAEPDCEPPPPPKPKPSTPKKGRTYGCNGAREVERRRRQIAAAALKKTKPALEGKT